VINDLDETLRTLLVTRAGLGPDSVDISFEIPTKDWSTSTRPTINLYLYDIRENAKLRETYWNPEPGEKGQIKLKRLPLRIDLSYMITCWTEAIEDQHRLLWQVLDAFFRNSPIPADVLQGNLTKLTHSVRTEVAQSDGILKNVSDFWGALENQLRPAVNVVVTLDLDLEQFQSAQIVFARSVKVGPRAANAGGTESGNQLRALMHGSDPAAFQVVGTVRDSKGLPVRRAAVRLIAVEADGQPAQRGPTILTDETGRYLVPGIGPRPGAGPLEPGTDIGSGNFTLVVEPPDGRPENVRLTPTELELKDPEKRKTIVREVVVGSETP
jgi:hypothetical protein